MFSYVCQANSASRSKVDSCENFFSQLTKSFNHFTNRFILPFQRKFGKESLELEPRLLPPSVINGFFGDIPHHRRSGFVINAEFDHSSEFNREIEKTNLPVPYNEKTAILNRQLEQIKNSRENDVADILNGELEQIRNTQEEAHLKARGFKPSYYSGVDQAREFARVGEYVRNINADPYTTHIPYFANRIDSIIRNVERNIRSGEKLDSTIEKLRILEGFKEEAQQRIDSKKVTYEWWILFHLRLFILAVNYHRFSTEHYSKEDLLIHIRTHEGMKVIVDGRSYYGEVFNRNNESVSKRCSVFFNKRYSWIYGIQ